MLRSLHPFILMCALSASGCVAQQTLGAAGNIPGELAAPETLPAVSMPNLDAGGLTKASPSPALISQHNQSMNRLWYASIGFLIAADAADAFSSWHRHEVNPLLASSNGTFGAKGVGLKIGLSAVILAPQYFFRRDRNMRKVFTLGNLFDGGLLSGTTIHNFAITNR